MKILDWKNIKIEGIANIEKCVGEFNVGELLKTPYSKFKVKVFESQKGVYTEYTNLFINDDPGVGSGKSVEDALKETIENFLEMINENQCDSEEDFNCADPFDF